MKWLERLRSKINNRDKTLELPTIPGEEQEFEWNDHKIVYSVLGEGKPLLVVHGANASAWRFEIRRNIEPFAQNGYKVYAPDMPGFGKSTRLAQPYTAQQYIAFLKDFAREIKEREGQPVAVIATTLVAAHIIGAAAQSPELFGPLLLICPTGIKHLASKEPSQKQRRAFELVTGSFGKVLFRLLTSRPSTRIFLSHDAYYDKNYVSDAIVEGYHRAARFPNAIYAPYSFLTEYLSYNVTQEWANLQQPTVLFWGDKSKNLPLTDLDDFVRLRPDTEYHIFTNTCLGLNDERAEEFNPMALEILERLTAAQPTIAKVA